MHSQLVGGMPGYWQDGLIHTYGPSTGVTVIAQIAESLSPSLYYLSCLVGGKTVFLE